MKSKNIEDYIQGDLSEIKPNVPLSFDIYLFFPQNRHILLWRKSNEIPTPVFISRYKKRGIEKIWVHRDDAEAYAQYVNPCMYPPVPAIAQDATNAKVIEMPEPDRRAQTALFAKESRVLMNQLTSAKDPAEQIAINDAAKRAVNDLAQEASAPTGSHGDSLVHKLWDMSDLNADLLHSTNVATYAVIFAMAFGRSDPASIRDVALAGLLHDIGLSQLPRELAITPYRMMNASQSREYTRHVDEGVEILHKYGGSRDVNDRVKQIVLDHHEKFDGSGYPRKLQGFKIHDLAQFLAIAELLDTMATGLWDGERRTLGASLEILSKIEHSRTFPEYFNPEIFSAVLRWSEDPAAKRPAAEARKVVENQSMRAFAKTGT